MTFQVIASATQRMVLACGWLSPPSHQSVWPTINRHRQTCPTCSELEAVRSGSSMAQRWREGVFYGMVRS